MGTTLGAFGKYLSSVWGFISSRSLTSFKEDQQHWHNLIGLIILIGGALLIFSCWLKNIFCDTKVTRSKEYVSEILGELPHPKSPVACDECKEEEQSKEMDYSHGSREMEYSHW